MAEIEYEAQILWSMFVKGKSYEDIEAKIKAITDALDSNKTPYTIRPVKQKGASDLAWLDR